MFSREAILTFSGGKNFFLPRKLKLGREGSHYPKAYFRENEVCKKVGQNETRKIILSKSIAK